MLPPLPAVLPPAPALPPEVVPPLPDVVPPLPPFPGPESPTPPVPGPVVPPAPPPSTALPPSTPPSGMVGPLNRHQLNLKRSPLPPTNFRNRSCFPLPPLTAQVLVVQDDAPEPETSHVPSSVPV